MFLKLDTATVAAILIWQLFNIFRLGKNTAQADTTKEHDYSLERHQSAVHCSFWLTLLAVGLIEFQIHLSSTSYSNWYIKGPHFIAVVVLVGCFGLAALWFTGKRNPWMHRRLVYVGFIAALLTTISGGVLLVDLPSPPSSAG